MLPINTEGPWSGYVAAADLTIPATAPGCVLLVTLDTNGKVALNSATGTPIGVIREDFKSGVLVTVFPLRGRLPFVASATIAIADFLKPAANGLVAPEGTVTTRTVATIGQAETAGSANGGFYGHCG